MASPTGWTWVWVNSGCWWWTGRAGVLQCMESQSWTWLSSQLNWTGLYSPWNCPSQNTGVGSLSLLQGLYLTQESNPSLLHFREILYQLSSREAPKHWSWYPIPFPVDLPDPGIKPGSPAFQANYLPTELWSKLHEGSPMSEAPQGNPIESPYDPTIPLFCMYPP